MSSPNHDTLHSLPRCHALILLHYLWNVLPQPPPKDPVTRRRRCRGRVIPRSQSSVLSLYGSVVATERCGGAMISPLVAIRSTTARSSRGNCGGRRRSSSSRFTLSFSSCSWWCVVHVVVVGSADRGRHFFSFECDVVAVIVVVLVVVVSVVVLVVAYCCTKPV